MSRKYFTKYAVELVKDDDCRYEAKIDTAYDAYSRQRDRQKFMNNITK